MNAAQIGEPGTGKTYNLRTLNGFVEATKKPVAIIDVDGKMGDDPIFAPLLEKGHFVRFNVGQRTVEGKLTNRVRAFRAAPQEEPKGYLAVAAAIDKLTEDSDKYCAVVLDTLTVTQEHLRKLISFLARKGQFEYPEWGSFLLNMEELFTSFYAINVPLKIVNMHQKLERDEATGAFKILPFIDGQFRDKVGQYISEFFLTHVKIGRGGVPEYCWYTHPNGQFNARSNVFNIQELVVPQDWTPIWQKLL